MAKSDIGFSTQKYLLTQSRKIRERISGSHGKLYIEFGGKILQDRHAARVLPGYDEDAKLKLIKKLCRHGEIIFVVSAKDIARGRIRGDFRISYDRETMRVIRELEKHGLTIKHVAISLLELGKPIPKAVISLRRRLNRLGKQTHLFYASERYTPRDFDPDSLGINPFIQSRKKIICIMSPGGGSGKFGVCLSQLYHEMAAGVAPDYLKFETFPVHDLPLHHPVNLAFMAASADFYDFVVKDARHGKATSYNRDADNYELLHRLARSFKRAGTHLRRLSSATAMGANMLARGIVNDELVQKEAAAEIARRLIRYKFEVHEGKENPKVLHRVREILKML